MNPIEKIYNHVVQKLGLAFDKQLHLLVSFLLALAIRGDVIESIWAIVPLVAIFVLKEVYDCVKTNATGFSLSDLLYDLVGGIAGYVIAVFV